MDIDPIPPKPYQPYPLDPDEFRPYLEGCNLTHEQQTELLHALWKIICACAEIGFKGDPIALVFQEHMNDQREQGAE